jgi:SAM-dependent methyltransferase
MYEYDQAFYRYLNEGAVSSARAVVPEVLAVLPDPVDTVLDVGCAAGAWLSAWKENGCRILGLDGDYVDAGEFLIAPDEFMAADLAQGFDLERRFDVVQCLEVAEHLPPSAASVLVESLCRHADIVVFSAAPPGQGGENHLNEQPYGYWRGLFAAQGFRMYDAVRPRVRDNKAVMPWYRYNIFLYVRESSLPHVHAGLAPVAVADAHGPRDVSPMPYRVRKLVIRILPHSLQIQLARLKKTMFNLTMRFRRGWP